MVGSNPTHVIVLEFSIEYLKPHTLLKACDACSGYSFLQNVVPVSSTRNDSTTSCSVKSSSLEGRLGKEAMLCSLGEWNPSKDRFFWTATSRLIMVPKQS